MSTPVRGVLVLAAASTAVAAYVVLTASPSSSELVVDTVERPSADVAAEVRVPLVPTSGDTGLVNLNAATEDVSEPDVVEDAAPPTEFPSAGVVVQSAHWLTEQLAVGVLNEDDVLTFAEGMLAHIDDVEPTQKNGRVLYELMNTPGCKATLNVKEPDAEGDARRYTLSVDVATQAGRITGVPEDGAERMKVSMTFKDDGESSFVSTLGSAEVRAGPVLRDSLDERPVPYGGSLVIRSNTAEAKTLTVERKEVEGEVVVMHRMHEVDPAPVGLANPRFGSLFAKLETAKKP